MSESWEDLRQDFAAYLAGDALATRRLFAALERALQGFYFVRLPSREESEDLTQTALLKIHFARDRYDRNLSLKTWVFTLARNALIDHWRGAKQESLDSVQSEMLDSLPTEEDLAKRIQSLGDLKKSFAHLKPIDRSLVYLCGVEGLSMAEAAAVLGLSEGSAKVRAHRAYAKLRELLTLALLTVFWRQFV